MLSSRWLEVATSDGDAGRRGEYSLALVFSEAVKARHKWEIALKGFNLIESPLVREWKDAAKTEGKVESLVRLVQMRYKGVAPEVTEGIRACRDPQKLDSWLDVALLVDTLEEFRKQTGL